MDSADAASEELAYRIIASILHDGDTTVGDLKQALTAAGIVVRP